VPPEGATTLRPPVTCEKLNVLMCWLMLKAWVTEQSLSIVTFEIAAASGVWTKKDCP
jgi:hypothetical protein